MHIQLKRTTLSIALSFAVFGLANAAAPQPGAEQVGKPDAQSKATAEADAKSAADKKAESGKKTEAGKPAAGDTPEMTELGEVKVQGYRQSLQYSTETKRESTGFTDAIFAEDIGKFPDTNIAESINRVPGIQLMRDVNGEGQRISIRGLGDSFNKTIINGGEVATASIGLLDQNQNREVDLNLFPTEFFNKLTIYKTPQASLPEGGIAGVVDLRSSRPFDNPGAHLTYQLQANYNDVSEKTTPQGAVTTSWTNDDGTFGVLVGVASVRGKIGVRGFETIGWTNAGLTSAQCGSTSEAICNPSGGGNWRIPDVVPNNAAVIAAGLNPGDVIDRDWLLAHNPGLDIGQISDALIPRLGRPVSMTGERDRDAFLGSLEWRPGEDAHYYLDTLYSKARRTNERIDMNLIGRNGNLIPIDMQVDDNNVVTDATFTNAQFFLEARPFREDVQYWNLNPGATFWFGSEQDIKLDVQANASRSWMVREFPTILVNSPFTTIEYANTGDEPTWTTGGLDLNDPNAGWTWSGGRVNVQGERRLTTTEGARSDLQFGDDSRNVKVGVAYDKASRRIRGFDNSAAWEDAVCRGLNPDGSTPDPRPACVGGPLAAIPQSALASYLRPGPDGFITVDFDRFFGATNYDFYWDNAPESGGSASANASTGGIDEKTWGAYVETNGDVELAARRLRYNAGVRYAKTDQEISGPVTIGGVRQWQTLDGSYKKALPSFNLAWDVADDVVLRLAASRTLTRPNPSSMLPNTNFGDQSAQTASQGNPNLKPYTSDNLDLGGEWYTGDEGFVGLALFRKDVKGYTYMGNTTLPFAALGIPFDDLTPAQQTAITNGGGPDSWTVTVAQQVNADAKLKITGWEATWVQPLNFLVDGLGIMANYTHIDLKTSGNQADALAGNLYGIAPKMWNATAYYENHGFSARLSYNYTAGYRSSGANENSIPYAYRLFAERDQWDLSASYTLESLPSSPQITLNVLNLTGDSQRRQDFYFGNAPYEIYDPGRTVMVGIRGTF